jgi:hypothetical protein
MWHVEGMIIRRKVYEVILGEMPKEKDHLIERGVDGNI